MKFYRKRGKRIRPSDTSLFFQFIFWGLFGVWLVFFIPFHLKFLLSTTWELDPFQTHFVGTYGFTSLIISLVLVAICAFVYYRYRYNHLKQLMHRQKLAKMILDNQWYETKQVINEGFFKDIPSSKAKEKMTHLPLLNLEKKLESGLYCELVSKELHDSYVEYVLFYDMIANRISIDEVIAQNGRLKLMKAMDWEYDQLPHMLIAGGTGGGKTYFILTLIEEALLKTDATLYILDPKNADLADLNTVMPDVYYKKEDMMTSIDQFYEDMMARSEEMKQMQGYKTGENYAYLGLTPHFLIFDEYVAFMEMLASKESTAVLTKLKRIVMLGRQAGFFLILACQRPDAKYLGDGIRDQFNFRVALGKMSELGYGMMFGSDVQKQFFLKQIKGRGYVDKGDNVITEFYTPLVPKDHDFLKEIEKAWRQPRFTPRF